MNLKNCLTLSMLKERKSSIRKIFFYRICGTGMGSAATLLKSAGYEVEGADLLFYPPMSDYLKQSKIPCLEIKDITPSYLKNFDLIVVGNVVGGKSEDARMIEELGVPFVSFPAALGGLLLCDINVIGIAGTHGKTTTTYLATQVFEKLEEKPGYMIGGVLENRDSGSRGDGKYFFIESDEYDSAYFEKFSKFRSYEINHLILTSLEFDHADIFKNIEEIKDQFKAIIPTLPGRYILSADYPAIIDLANECAVDKKRISFYGASETLGPKIHTEGPTGTSFSLNVNGHDEVFMTNIIGKHNILNLSSVLIYALSEGFSLPQLRSAIQDLKLVKRRQEVRGLYKGVTVIDDFAHHPRAVEVTIDSIRSTFPGKKVFTIIEPNSATARSSIFQDGFAQALATSDKVLVAKPKRPTTVTWSSDLDMDKLVTDIHSLGKRADFATDLETLRAKMDQMLVPDEDILLILSNGTCLGLWESSFVDELKK